VKSTVRRASSDDVGLNVGEANGDGGGVGVGALVVVLAEHSTWCDEASQNVVCAPNP